MALEKTVNEKIAAAQPTQAAKKQGESQYIRWIVALFPYVCSNVKVAVWSTKK